MSLRGTSPSAACDPVELNDIVQQLRAALHEHATRVRKFAAEKLITKQKVNGASAVAGNSVTDDVTAD